MYHSSPLFTWVWRIPFHGQYELPLAWLSWHWDRWFPTGTCPTSAEIIVSQSRKSYQQWRWVHFPVPFHLINQIIYLGPALSLSPHICTWILTYTMKIRMRCMHGSCCSTMHTQLFPRMASLLPYMSWSLVSGSTCPEIVSDPLHVQLFIFITHGILIWNTWMMSTDHQVWTPHAFCNYGMFCKILFREIRMVREKQNCASWGPEGGCTTEQWSQYLPVGR